MKHNKHLLVDLIFVHKLLIYKVVFVYNTKI